MPWIPEGPIAGVLRVWELSMGPARSRGGCLEQAADITENEVL